VKPDELADRIERGGGRRPAGKQLALLGELVELYERAGLITEGIPEALWRCCPERDACWLPEQWAERPGFSDAEPRSEKGCMFAPWVGPAYEPGGVCVVAVNLRYDGGDWDLAVEHLIATGHGGQEERLRAGRRRAHRSSFAWRSLRGAAAVIRASQRRDTLDIQDGAELADTLLMTARLQSVKCSPNDHRRSQRSPAMKIACPPRYLGSELEILRPRTVIAYGAEARSALALCGALETAEETSGFARGLLRRGDSEFEVFALAHPAARGRRWPQAHEALLTSLMSKPPH
jgi:hypothetical protein